MVNLIHKQDCGVTLVSIRN